MNDIFTSIRRTPYQSLGSFLILFFTMFLSLFFFNLTSFFHGMLEYVETRPQVIIYFDANTEEQAILQLKDQLEQSPKTQSVSYVSQKEALKIYRDLNKDNPLLLEMVSAQILPASLEVYATEPKYLAEIAQRVKDIEIVDEVNYQELIVEKLVTLTTILRRISIGLLMFLILISMVVLLATTAFKIAIKRDEIEVLQLIGATKGYIRKPFLVEGMLFGWSSATFAFILFYGIFLYFQPFLGSYLSGIPRLAFFNMAHLNLYVFPPTLEYIALTYILVTFFGMMLGYIGNHLATSKYIK